LHIGVHTTNFVSTLRVFHSFKNDVTLRSEAHLLIWQRGGQKETETEDQWKRDREVEKKSYKKWQLQTPLSTISNPWPGHTPS